MLYTVDKEKTDISKEKACPKNEQANFCKTQLKLHTEAIEMMAMWIVGAIVAVAAVVFLWYAFTSLTRAAGKCAQVSDELEDNGTIQG